MLRCPSRTTRTLSAISTLMGRWQNLTETPYEISFISSETKERRYPTGMIRASISGISDPSELHFTLNGSPVDLSTGFPNTPEWNGSRDRRWIEAHIGEGTIKSGRNLIQVDLTEEGRATSEPQGGKMITSVEVIQYGEADKYASCSIRDAQLMVDSMVISISLGLSQLLTITRG